jgi:hypothetical protein
MMKKANYGNIARTMAMKTNYLKMIMVKGKNYLKMSRIMIMAKKTNYPKVSRIMVKKANYLKRFQ